MNSTLHAVLVVVAALVVAYILWQVVKFAIAVFLPIVVIAAVVYIAFILVRSSTRRSNAH